MNYTNYFEFPYSARQNQKFVSVMDGYNKGNLLAGEYIPYRNYEPKLPINVQPVKSPVSKPPLVNT